MPRTGDDLLKEAEAFARDAGVQIVVFATALLLAGVAIDQHYSARTARAIRAPVAAAPGATAAPAAAPAGARAEAPVHIEVVTTLSRASPGRPAVVHLHQHADDLEVRSGRLAKGRAENPVGKPAPAPRPAAQGAPGPAGAEAPGYTGVGHCIHIYQWRRAQLAWRTQALHEVERSQRAGVRNLQIRSPTEADPLRGLAEKMDLVFVDAPCTGSGTWRRHPDAKWRLSPDQLERRMADQDAVLTEAATFVKPGGRLVYVTCSLLAEENEDRVAAFLAAHDGWTVTPPALDTVHRFLTADGYLSLTPRTAGTDGFFAAVLARA